MDGTEAFAGDGTLFGIPVLRNEALLLPGSPDGVIADGGGLAPVEIKSHEDPRRTDVLEIPFYWLLLEPYRPRTDPRPYGRMLLRCNGIAEPVDVGRLAGLFSNLIGETGFEPATARPPAGCATRLRHSPWSGNDSTVPCLRDAT
jgi:hypothetical protein